MGKQEVSRLALILLSFLTLSSSKTLRDLSVDEFRDLSKSTSGSFVAVYFDKKDTRQKHPNFFKEYRKAADELEAYGIELARVDCDSQALEECHQSNVYTYFRTGEFEDSLELDTLYNVDSIVANLLHTLLKHELGYIYDNSYAEDIFKTSRGKKDVIIAFVKGFGSKANRAVVEIAFVYGDKVSFAITTDKDVAKGIIPGLTDTQDAALVAYLCKSADMLDNCTILPYKNKIDTFYVGQFLELLNLPKLIELPSDGKTVFDVTSLAVNKVYVFSNPDQPSAVKRGEVQKLAEDLYGTTGVIYVDVKKHKDKIAQFGLSDDTIFPTGALVPSTNEKDAKEKIVELFPEIPIEFSPENLKQFVLKILANPQKEYKRQASSSSLRVLPLDEFKNSIKDEDSSPYSTAYIVVAQCEHDNLEAGCSAFVKNVRRLVRTFDRLLISDFTPVYVLLKKEDILQEFGSENVPSVRLYSKTDGGLYNPQADWTGPHPDYDMMLQFIKLNTKAILPRLPPSNTDDVPVSSQITAGKHVNEDKEEGDAEEGDEEDGGIPPEETEDDEVAGAVWYTSPPKVPEDKVPSLTDKTFNPIREQHDLLVVNFFQPWDPRSKAIVGPYLDAALNLGKIDIGNYDVQLARVNCFDWTDVCQNNNITIYPTIKLYRKGAYEMIYGGPLDADHLVKAVLLLQQSSPLHLKNIDEIDSYLKGELPKNAAKATNIAVFGVFQSEDSSEFKAFKAAAENLRGKFLLSYATGNTAKTESMSFGLKSPSILVIKRDDPVIRRLVFDRPFTEENIMEFVRLSCLQTYGELTQINLPLYYKHRRPLLISFRDDTHADTALAPVMERIAADSSLPTVFLCWMALSSNDVNGAILESYTGSTTVPALVLVDHNKSAVYKYEGPVGSREGVIEWANSCLADDKKPTRMLKKSNWSPLLEGYDYLKMMDHEAAMKKKKQEHSDEDDEGFEESGDLTEESPGTHVDKKHDRLRQRKPEDFRKKEKDTHDHEHDEL